MPAPRVDDEIAAIRDCEELIVGVGRAFYSDECVLVLEVLVNEKYLKDGEMGRRLQMSEKQARRALQFLEQERLVLNETISRASEEKKGSTAEVYWYIDLANFRDVVKFRLHKMRELVREKERLASTSQWFKCVRCGTRQSAIQAVRFRFKCPERDCEEVQAALVEEPLDASIGNAQRLMAKIQQQLTSTEGRTGLFELLSRLEDRRLPANKPSDNRARGLGGAPIFVDCSTTTMTTRSSASKQEPDHFSGSAAALFATNLKGQEIVVDFQEDEQGDERAEPQQPKPQQSNPHVAKPILPEAITSKRIYNDDEEDGVPWEEGDDEDDDDDDEEEEDHDDGEEDSDEEEDDADFD